MFGGLTIVTPPTREPLTLADARAHSRVAGSIEDDAMLGGYLSVARRKCEEICRRAFMPQTWRYALKHWPGRSYGELRQSGNLADYYRWNEIEIPLPPLVSIASFTYADTLGTTSNMTQGYGNQVGNYLLDLDSEPGRIVLPFSGIWPTTVLLPGNPILITYLAGYSTFASSVDVSTAGVVTWKSGDTFSEGLAGSWVNIAGASYSVASFTDDQHLQLAISAALGAATDQTFTANLVPMPIREAILLLAGHYYESREAVLVTESRATLAEVPSTVDYLLADYRIKSKRR